MGVSFHSPQRLQRVLRWRQPCRASTLTLPSSKRYSLRPAGRTSDFQFQLNSLRVFTPTNSLKRRCPHPRGSRGTPPIQLAQRMGKRRTDLSHNRQSFLTTSSALLHCATPVTNVLMKFDGPVWDTTWCQTHRAPDPVADVNMHVRWPKQVECLNGGRNGY